MLRLNIAYMHAKSDHSSFSRSGDVGVHQSLNGLCDLTTPLSGIVCHPSASTCYGQPIYQIYLKSLFLPTTIRKAIQNSKNKVGWVGVVFYGAISSNFECPLTTVVSGHSNFKVTGNSAIRQNA